MDFTRGPRQSITARSINGCWTCRLRRKKCDEKHPVCDVCTSLNITCHFDPKKPEWMDGGVRQEEMAEQIKRKIKERDHRRRHRDRTVSEATTGQELPTEQASPDTHNNGKELCPEVPASVLLQRKDYCTLISKEPRESIAFGRTDTILFMFYLEHLFPFLFPFYHPSLWEGGKAWILELIISSPVVRSDFFRANLFKLGVSEASYSLAILREFMSLMCLEINYSWISIYARKTLQK
jgi:hypothetical protein